MVEQTSPERAPFKSRYMLDPGWIAREAIDHQGCLASPGELTVLLSMIESAGIETVLEIGTYAGGSAWAFSRIATVDRIITIDVDPQPGADVALASLPCPVTQIVGDSRSPDTVKVVRDQLGGNQPELLFIDGAHDYMAARSDWVTYSPLVASGGMVVFHDSQPGPNSTGMGVPKLFGELADSYRSTRIADNLLGPNGTGILWV